MSDLALAQSLRIWQLTNMFELLSLNQRFRAAAE